MGKVLDRWWLYLSWFIICRSCGSDFFAEKKIGMGVGGYEAKNLTGEK
jgi:hypothetical protein